MNPIDTNQPRGVAVLSMAEIVAKSPDPVAAIKALGATVAKSQMMGPTDRVEIGEVIVTLCITSGMTLMDVFRTYQISFGRLEKKIDAAMAEFRARGGKVEWLADGGDGQTARARFTMADESLEAACTVDEAKKAGWTKNAKWTTEPQTMLRARVKKRGIVALAPDIFFGEDTEDRDMTPVTVDAAQMAAAAARSVTPAPAPKPAPAPVVTPAPAPAATPTPAAPPAAPTELDPLIQGKLVDIIGDKLALATLWARSVNWLTAEQTLEDLPEKHAKAIIAKPDRFKTALAAFEAKEGAK